MDATKRIALQRYQILLSIPLQRTELSVLHAPTIAMLSQMQMIKLFVGTYARKSTVTENYQARQAVLNAPFVKIIAMNLEVLQNELCATGYVTTFTATNI